LYEPAVNGPALNQLDHPTRVISATTSDEALLRASSLSRWEGNACLVDDISLSVSRGEVLGLLGLNGAGKSTTLNLLSGVLLPSLGDVEICGHSLFEQPMQAKRCIGYLPEIPPLYMDMTVCAYLDFCARLHGMRGRKKREAVERALADCALQDVGKRIIRNLSKGYRQRIGLAQAIIHRPEVILLDEPSSGLDPQQMHEMRALIRRLAADCGIVFSSHLLSEVTDLCDRICVIHNGQVIHQQRLDDSESLIPAQGANSVREVTLKLKEMVTSGELHRLTGVLHAKNLPGQRWQIKVMSREVDNLPAHIVGQGWHLLELQTDKPSLEDLFTGLVTDGAASGNVDTHDEPENTITTNAAGAVAGIDVAKSYDTPATHVKKTAGSLTATTSAPESAVERTD